MGLINVEKREATETPKSDAALRDDLPRFCEEMTVRLTNGKRVYGDSSFERPMLDLIREIKAECLDQAGWGFIGWQRLDALEKQLERAAVQVLNGK